MFGSYISSLIPTKMTFILEKNIKVKQTKKIINKGNTVKIYFYLYFLRNISSEGSTSKWMEGVPLHLIV